MELSAEEISKIVDGKLIGNGVTSIRRVAPIENADNNSITFLTHPKYQHHLSSTRAPAILVGQDFNINGFNGKTFIVVKEVYAALSDILQRFHPDPNTINKKGISGKAHIDSSARIGNNVYAGPGAVINEGVKIGDNVKIFPNAYIGDFSEIQDNTIIYPGVVIYARTQIGRNCILHAGCVIGSDGFGFVPQETMAYKKIPHAGKVFIGDNVEIGANTTIDRATMEATVIEDGVKLDNLIQVAHNVVIGKNTVIAAQAGISGSTKIGRSNQIGGQAGIIGHIKTADGSSIGAQSGVGKDLKEPGKKWHGSPAEPYRLTLRSQALVKNLPDMQNKLHRLEEELKILKQRLGTGQNNRSND